MAWAQGNSSSSQDGLDQYDVDKSDLCEFLVYRATVGCGDNGCDNALCHVVYFKQAVSSTFLDKI